CAFWAALTGQEVRPARVEGFSYLTRSPGWPIRILLQRREAAAPGDPVRGHLDLGCTDPDAVRRHTELGARVTGRQPFWTVLTDPAGQAYCLIDREPG
ncbi:MAG TPA: VOC family protein, partial [Trebonia sp.]|nr:VOC family protein [Trebonia sp.]